MALVTNDTFQKIVGYRLGTDKKWATGGGFFVINRKLIQLAIVSDLDSSNIVIGQELSNILYFKVKTELEVTGSFTAPSNSKYLLYLLVSGEDINSNSVLADCAISFLINGVDILYIEEPEEPEELELPLPEPLTVGIDTYISLLDANTYIRTHYTAAQAAVWDSLSNADKDAYLRQGCAKIDSQRLAGKKASLAQKLEFPRAIFSAAAHRYITQKEVPDAVKSAQVEEAFALSKGIPKRLELQRQGVKSFRLGELSEEYTGTMNNTLISETSRQLLRPFLAGGVPIC